MHQSILCIHICIEASIYCIYKHISRAELGISDSASAGDQGILGRGPGLKELKGTLPSWLSQATYARTQGWKGPFSPPPPLPPPLPRPFAQGEKIRKHT